MNELKLKINKLITYSLCGLIMLYRCLVSPILRQRCRFLPTCSSYGIEALQEWGWWQGGRLLVCRILKCHPWGASGCDPVPKAPLKTKDR